MTNAFFSDHFSIGPRQLGAGQPVYLIAEAGVAHFGQLEKAFKLVDLAISAGADAVKFQIFRTENLISKASGEWIDRLKPKELPPEAFVEIAGYCRACGIPFLATAHDETSLTVLDRLEVQAYKIGSGEICNWPYLEKIASRMKPVILSTGMYTLSQIEEALAVFKSVGNREVAVLHCVTRYPTPPAEVNLNAIKTIRNRFSVVTGYSDHTRGFHFPMAAVVMGAKIIEKHITLDYDVPNAQDWKVSCGKKDLPEMVAQIRELEKGMGTGEKKPGPDEIENLRWARKSLVSACELKAGETVTADKLCIKRPGTGIPPHRIEEVIGKTIRNAMDRDLLITWENLK